MVPLLWYARRARQWLALLVFLLPNTGGRAGSPSSCPVELVVYVRGPSCSTCVQPARLCFLHSAFVGRHPDRRRKARNYVTGIVNDQGFGWYQPSDNMDEL